ncbi:hypothetical protein [Streptomyces platensis]|uniref:hypothetical protein n=1 Tax=Streptomyces platensis TaxID=58346 RepID=UPI002E26287B
MSFRTNAVDLINSSWGMHTLNELLIELVLALIRELDEQAGMAGDDDAGRAIAALYDSASKTTVNQAGEASHVMGRGSESLLQTANNYMATESKVAEDMLAAIGQRSASEPYSGKSADCAPGPRERTARGHRGDLRNRQVPRR